MFCTERGTNWYYRLVIIVVLLLCMLKQCFFSADNVSECLSCSVLCRICQLFVCLCRFLQMNLLSTFLINNNCSSSNNNINNSSSSSISISISICISISIIINIFSLFSEISLLISRVAAVSDYTFFSQSDLIWSWHDTIEQMCQIQSHCHDIIALWA